jgi:hypothetical protein
MHHLRRSTYLGPVQRPEALVTEADTERRKTAFAENIGTYAEVVVRVRASRSWRYDHGIDSLLGPRAPSCVVMNNDRRLACDLGQELEEIVGIRVVIIYEQDTHVWAAVCEWVCT